MAIGNIFKKKLKDYNPPAALPPKGRAPKPAEKPKPIEKPSEVEPLKIKKERRVVGEAWRVLKTPHVTEKAADLAEKNQYVFKVWPRVNKTEIGKAIEDIYGVDVLSVRIIKVPRKQRRLGKIQGWRKGYKKAIVKIKEGQKIEIMPK